MNIDIPAGSKFKSSSQFGFKSSWISIFELAGNSNKIIKLWISIFELARNSNPARYLASKYFEFRSSSWFEIQIQLEMCLQSILNIEIQLEMRLQIICISIFKVYCKIINFDLRTRSKFKASSKCINNWISVFYLRC